MYCILHQFAWFLILNFLNSRNMFSSVWRPQSPPYPFSIFLHHQKTHNQRFYFFLLHSQEGNGNWGDGHSRVKHCKRDWLPRAKISPINEEKVEEGSGIGRRHRLLSYSQSWVSPSSVSELCRLLCVCTLN